MSSFRVNAARRVAERKGAGAEREPVGRLIAVWRNKMRPTVAKCGELSGVCVPFSTHLGPSVTVFFSA